MLVNKYYPQWVKKGKFEGCLLLNPNFILALEELGISLKNPWTVHGGYADRLAAENQAMYNHYIKEGLSKEKTILTGTPYCDYVKTVIDSDEKYLEAFFSSKKICKGTTKILICWPPSYHEQRGHLCEYSSYEMLTKTVISHLVKIENIDVTINIHPAVESQILTLIKESNINISKKYILEDIPKHDIYVSCYSSTIRWAIAARKPVINYDFYSFNINDYSDVKGVLKVKTHEEFIGLLNKFINDDHYYQRIAKLQKEISGDWGMLDGKNFDRIYNLINELTEN